MPQLDQTGAVRVAVDIGGTFTDIVIQDSASGEIKTGKVLSTPDNPARAVLSAIAAHVPDGRRIGFFVHGTTVGLNAVLERRGARVALLMTDGFQDVYSIGSSARSSIFSLRFRKPAPLVEPSLVLPIGERINSSGRIDRAVSPESVEQAIVNLSSQSVEAVAVCLLFSYLAPSHELEVAKAIGEALKVPVVTSHQVSPEWREYERASTTVMTAYIAPVVERYIATLVGLLADISDAQVHVMQSNGGVMSASTASQRPIQTLLSGPVGGAIGAREVSRQLGVPNVICVDMGGTSFDVCLVIDGEATVTSQAEVDGLPLQMSAVDISGIGAGGGSIARAEAGALRVGPKSAGSVPGPVCYGRGGTEPTVTDANFVLGRVDSRNFAGGGMDLRLEEAHDAIRRLGTELGIGIDEAAQGILDVVNAAMADAIRTQTVKRGIDPRDFALVAYGGAGPMHAVAIADELGVREVIVPNHPGTFSAWGMLQTDIRHDIRRTFASPLATVDVGALEDVFERLTVEGRNLLLAERVSEDEISWDREIDLRYFGQEYSLTVPLPTGDFDSAALRQEFDRLYRRRYGHSSGEAPVEIVKLAVRVTGLLDRPKAYATFATADIPSRLKAVSFSGTWLETPIVPRETLIPGTSLIGPAIIEESTATTVVPPGWAAVILPEGHLLVSKLESE